LIGSGCTQINTMHGGVRLAELLREEPKMWGLLESRRIGALGMPERALRFDGGLLEQ